MSTTPIDLLIAEDEPAHVEAIRRSLAKTPVAIRAVGTLREYRACVAERPPDIALVDLNLPDGQALEILTAPPELAPFPVIVMTAFGNQATVVEVLKHGALNYLVKYQDTFDNLPSTLELVLREWRVIQIHHQAELSTAVRLRLIEFVEGHSLDEFLQKLLDELEVLTGSQVGFYHFVLPDQKTLTLQTWSTRTMTQAMCQAEGAGRHYDLSTAGVWADCVRERRPLIHNDYAALPNRKGLPPGHAPIIRELVVPVLRGDRVVAVLGMGNKPHDYDDEDVAVVAQLADSAWEIVERKRAETALAAAHEELRQHAEKLEQTVSQRTADLQATVADLEAFAYSLSHDMRAPLRAVKSYIDLVFLDKGNQLTSTSTEYLGRISVAARRLDQLIQDVLLISRLSQRNGLQMEPVDVEKLLRTVIAERPGWQPPAATIVIDSPLLPVQGHIASLSQCVTNLLTNAVKFVAPGVVPHVRIWSEAVEDSVRIWVEDNGIGISADSRSQLFKMFSRIPTPTAYDGTGIGLAIVWKAVSNMGGRVGVESEPGQGSRFWLLLPKSKS